MTASHQLVYFIFAIVLVLALILDLGLLSKKDKTITIKQALLQTLFWVALAIGFFVFVWVEEGQKTGLEYLSAYLMEWSLSVDNIFVFILIFNAFKVNEKYYPRVLLVGILMAIVFRVLFITVGVALVEQFHWLLYIFGIFLLYTGFKMFTSNESEEFDPHDTAIYRFLKKYLPLSGTDGNGKYVIRVNGKPQYTTLFVVVALLAVIDLVFALDSIPAVMGISTDKLVIYTSNILAILGLRSLYFVLARAIENIKYLKFALGIVLVIVGLKLIFSIHLHPGITFVILAVIFSSSIILSMREKSSRKIN